MALLVSSMTHLETRESHRGLGVACAHIVLFCDALDVLSEGGVSAEQCCCGPVGNVVRLLVVAWLL